MLPSLAVLGGQPIFIFGADVTGIIIIILSLGGEGTCWVGAKCPKGMQEHGFGFALGNK